MYESWLSSFGSDINIGVNTANVVAGNGAGNIIGGDVVAFAEQDVGDSGFQFESDSPFVGDINIAVNTANVVVGNGAFNAIGGDVMAIADQQVGDSDLGLLFT